MSETLFYIIVAFLLIDFILERFLDYLNSKRWTSELPKEVARFYDEEKYKKTIEYQRTLHNFSMITSSFSFALMVGMLFLKGFAWLDLFVRQYSVNPIPVALLFFGILAVASDILSLPFQIYSQFVIEKRFGFNKTTTKIFITDKIKTWVLGAILGGGIFVAIMWIYAETGEWFWVIALAFITLVMLVMTMFYSTWIVPLFNKQKPLEEGILKDSISQLAVKTGFKLDNIFVIDGSKRSTKANAYFSGIGSKKRIVLYDTLINEHSTEEIVAVLAHEIGHNKKKHTLTGFVFTILNSGLMLFLLSLFIGSSVLSQALGAEAASFHIGLLAFGLLYSPLSLLTGIILNIISRKHEFAADRFAAEHYNAEALKNALIKLSMNNLSNLTPHPVYVFFHYSHPPLLERIKALDNYSEMKDQT
jgi:STE24 endopeptidase